MKRDFTAAGPGQLWVADITHVRTWAGWSHLAVTLDAWSRRVVGWAMAPPMREHACAAGVPREVAGFLQGRFERLG